LLRKHRRPEGRKAVGVELYTIFSVSDNQKIEFGDFLLLNIVLHPLSASILSLAFEGKEERG
jgi:hypothetical protein